MFRHRENRRRRSTADRLQEWYASAVDGIRRVGPWVVLAAVAVAVPCLVYYGYHRVRSSPYFQVSNIEIEGVRHAEIERLAEEAELRHGVNIFAMERSEAEQALESSPWVTEARIDRQLPDALAVTVEERRPGAILVDEGFYVVDRSGRVVESIESPRRAGFADLPFVTGLSHKELDDGRGPELVRDAMRVADLYEELGLAEHRSLSEIHIDPVLGLTLVTEGVGTEIRIGDDRYRERLERLATVRRTLEERGVEPSYLLMDGESLDRITVGRRGRQGSAGRGAE